MSIIANDWAVTRATGDIRYIGQAHTPAANTSAGVFTVGDYYEITALGTTDFTLIGALSNSIGVKFEATGVGSGTGTAQRTASYATVIQLHRWLQDLADNLSSSGDDQLEISDLIPSVRSTDNIIKLLSLYNIDSVTSEHLFDGSIIQGSVGVDQIIYDGIVNFGNTDVNVQVIQNGAVTANDYWNQPLVGLNADPLQGISHRFLVKIHDFAGSGGDIDGRRLIGTSRRFNKTYSEFVINGTSRGNNVLALSDASDLNNSTAVGTVASWTSITNTEGFNQLDVDNNSVTEDYYSNWTLGTQTINDFYERLKWLTRDGSVATVYGLNGELFRGVTHEVNGATPTGTFNAFEGISWSTGTGQMLAIDSVTAGTKLWMQLLTGNPPTTEVVTGTTSGATITATSNVDRVATLATPFVGASTGSALIGSYGLGILPADLSANDKLFDLTNTQITPPNNVSFAVSGLVIGEDRVLLAPWDGATLDSEGNPAIDKAQLTTTASAINGAAVTAIPVTTNIPSDTPSTGSIRVLLNSGKYRSIPYTSYTGSTFTIPSTDFSTDVVNLSSDLWVAYIDKLATATTEPVTLVYLADRDFVAIVRDGGVTPIKQFISSAKLTNSGGAITAIRTSDL